MNVSGLTEGVSALSFSLFLINYTVNNICFGEIRNGFSKMPWREHIGRQTDRQKHKQTVRRTYRQTNGQSVRQVGRCLYEHCVTILFSNFSLPSHSLCQHLSPFSHSLTLSHYLTLYHSISSFFSFSPSLIISPFLIISHSLIISPSLPFYHPLSHSHSLTLSHNYTK